MKLIHPNVELNLSLRHGLCPELHWEILQHSLMSTAGFREAKVGREGELEGLRRSGK